MISVFTRLLCEVGVCVGASVGLFFQFSSDRTFLMKKLLGNFGEFVFCAESFRAAAVCVLAFQSNLINQNSADGHEHQRILSGAAQLCKHFHSYSAG